MSGIVVSPSSLLHAIEQSTDKESIRIGLILIIGCIFISGDKITRMSEAGQYLEFCIFRRVPILENLLRLRKMAVSAFAESVRNRYSG